MTPQQNEALSGQLLYLFEQMDEETAQACLREYPLKNEWLTAFGVNEWREAHQERKFQREQRREGYKQLPPRQPPSDVEKERVAQIVECFKELAEARKRAMKRPWPRINGKPVPPDVVMCPDGMLRLPIGPYKDLPPYFGSKS